jgi:hypothetical protein
MAKSVRLAKQARQTIAQGSIAAARPKPYNALAMSYAPKIVLQLRLSNLDLLPDFVEACIRDGVALIAVVGANASEVHDLIDELIVGDGSDTRRFIATTFHTDETLEEVIEFAKILEPERQAVELVKL